MAIESKCSGCGRQIRVADAHAGKKARCPACKTVYVVPGERLDASASNPVASPNGQAQSNTESTPNPAANPAASATHSGTTSATPSGVSSVRGSAPHADTRSPIQRADASPEQTRQPGASPQWMFRSENGHIYGPVGRDELNRWAAEGRVSRECHLQLIGGDGRWEPAMGWIDPNAIRHLATSGSLDSLSQGGSQAVAQPSAYPAYNYSYQTETAPGGYQRPLDRHRGGVILLYGVLGVGCPIFSVLAAVVGLRDLDRMNRGEMDPNGRVATQAGMVLGTVMASLQALGFAMVVMSS